MNCLFGPGHLLVLGTDRFQLGGQVRGVLSGMFEIEDTHFLKHGSGSSAHQLAFCLGQFGAQLAKVLLKTLAFGCPRPSFVLHCAPEFIPAGFYLIEFEESSLVKDPLQPLYIGQSSLGGLLCTEEPDLSRPSNPVLIRYLLLLEMILYLYRLLRRVL